MFCVQSGASGFRAAPPAADANSGNAQAQRRISPRQRFPSGHAQEQRRIHLLHRFSDDEEDRLRTLVERHGTKDWSLIAREMGNYRTARQYKERWYDYLHPELNHKPWTPEENARLRELVHQWGNKWVVIGRELGGRSGHMVMCHYQSLCRSRKTQPLDPPPQAPQQLAPLPQGPQQLGSPPQCPQQLAPTPQQLYPDIQPQDIDVQEQDPDMQTHSLYNPNQLLTLVLNDPSPIAALDDPYPIADLGDPSPIADLDGIYPSLGLFYPYATPRWYSVVDWPT
ncbi:MAG: hypothetical protein LBR89_01540 [Holosporales bacterium]|nr:hypothetical protein [Holosporales bacterium]